MLQLPGPLGESEKGDKRTGPALNPLKGSSARVPHIPTGCKPNAIPKSFFFITLLPKPA